MMHFYFETLLLLEYLALLVLRNANFKDDKLRRGLQYFLQCVGDWKGICPVEKIFATYC